MNVDLKKESIHVSEIRTPQTLTLLVEGDMIVPDINPDIKEVLLAEAGAVITGREYNDAKLTVMGSTAVKILYMPEETMQPKTMEAKFDFKDALELSAEENLTVSVSSRCEHVDFSLINSRKLHIKVVISITARSYVGRELAYPIEAVSPEEIKSRKRYMSAYRVLADTARELLVSESLEVPAGKPDIDELIKLDVHVRKDECKVMSGKILLKGSLVMNALYQSEESATERMEYELPFSEMVDVDGLEDGAVCHVRYSVKDVYCSVKEDINGDPRVIMADVVLMAEIMSGVTEEFEMIDDCYSTTGDVKLLRERVVLDELLSEGVSHENIKEIISVSEGMPPISVVYSLTCKPLVKEWKILDDKLMVNGRLVAFVLYGSSQTEESMHSLVHEFDFEHAIVVDGISEKVFCDCHASDSSVSFSINAAGEIELRCNLEIYTRVARRIEPELVTGCELSEAEEKQADASLIIYFVQPKETLWDVAKRYRIDGEKIKLLNQMEDEKLTAGQKILIPVR